MTRLGGAVELPVANIQPKATGEDVEEEGTVASSRFPSRTYAVYVHVSCPRGGEHVHERSLIQHRALSFSEWPRAPLAHSVFDTEIFT